MTLFSGIFLLPWWGYPVVALGLTHATIIAVTIYLHRHQTHRALELHPVISHCFRFWLWMTTGMVTREWVAVHRKHHACCETSRDPHSPQVLGISRVLWTGVILYVRESQDLEVVERYGRGVADDWIERHLYARSRFVGLALMGLFDVAALGFGWGLFVYAIQMVWIPFWGRGRHQRRRALLGLSQLSGGGREHKSFAHRHPDRRRGVAQQSSCASDVGEAVEHLV